MNRENKLGSLIGVLLVLILSFCVAPVIPASAQSDDGPNLNPLAQMITLNNQRKFSEALVIGQRMLKTFPKDIRFHFNVARAFNGLQRFDEALAEYKICVEIDPRNELGQKSQAEVDKLSKVLEAQSVTQVQPAAVPNVRNYAPMRANAGAQTSVQTQQKAAKTGAATGK